MIDCRGRECHPSLPVGTGQFYFLSSTDWVSCHIAMASPGALRAGPLFPEVLMSLTYFGQNINKPYHVSPLAEATVYMLVPLHDNEPLLTLVCCYAVECTEYGFKLPWQLKFCMYSLSGSTADDRDAFGSKLN